MERWIIALAFLLFANVAQAMVGSCPANFPDGIQSHYRGNDNGKIVFGSNAQLLDSPDAVLQAKVITKNSGHDIGTCGSRWVIWPIWAAPIDCSADSSSAAPQQTAGTFPATGSYSESLDLGWRGNHTEPGDGDNRYGNVTVGDSAQLTIQSDGQPFYIDRLVLRSSSRLILSPGDYWIGSLVTGNAGRIEVSGPGQVRLFVRNSFTLESNALLNSPSIGGRGDPQRLFLYAYGSVSFNNGATMNGYLYSASEVTLGSASYLYGAITAENVTLSTNSKVYYVAATGQCTEAAPPELRLSWSLDQSQWSGTAGEVVDDSGNGLHGRAINGAGTGSELPALPEESGEGTCRYGRFDRRNNQYVQTPHDDRLTLQENFTIGIWVKPRSLPSSGLMSILSKDANYEFHLNPNGTINWWWQTTANTTVDFNSRTALSVGKWNHVVIRYAPNNQRIYINGTEAGSAGFSGTPRANTDPLQLGWDQVAGRYFDGDLDELRVYNGALSESEIRSLSRERHACQSGLQCFGDDFDNGLSSDWAVSSRGETVFTPNVQNNRLRLTSSANKVATATALQRLFPAKGNFIQVEFDYFAYNGSGADGVAVILSDAAHTPQPGGFGGSLGYAQLNDDTNRISGFAGGWLGVALDEFGNFSNRSEGRDGGSGAITDSVSIRGSGSGLSGYRYLRGTGRPLSPGVDDASNRNPSPGHRYRITIDARAQGQALVTVERKTGSSFEVLPNLDKYNVSAPGNNQAALPDRFYLSLTGSTGASTNIHEIDNLNVCATEIEPIGQQIHHFDLRYSTPSLTCNPQDVTVRACLNADCSKLYNEEVTVSLTADGAVWQGGDSLTFRGGSGTAKVQATRIGESTIGVGGSTPPALSFGQTTCSTAGCKLLGVESGFVFDVPTLIANKPQADIWVRAVKADPRDPQKCVAGFAGGNKTIGFNSTYETPDSGTRSVNINGESVRTTAKDAATTYTPVSLKFDAEAKASMTVNYSDAGMMKLNAYYAPTEGNERGLEMRGSDLFLSKPYGIHIETDIDKRAAAERCNEATIAGCPVFVAAGDQFPVRFRAVGWDGSDTEPRTAEALKNNISTPNFSLSHKDGAFKLVQSLVAPQGGNVGELGVMAYDHALGEISTVTGQTISEVGIFQLTTSLNQNVNYFGEAVDGGTSNLIGRFIPARLGVIAEASLTPSCGVAFSYQGQPMAFAPGLAPHATVTAYNRAGGVTTNYDREPFWRLGTPTREPYRSIVVDKAALNGRLLTIGNASMTVVRENNGDGARLYRWTGEQLSYAPAVSPSPDDLPFIAAVEQTLAAASLTDADGACHAAASGSCQPYIYEFVQNPGSEVRFGRLKIGNAHGSELHGLDLPITVESWKAIGAGATFLPEGDDSCTTGASLDQVSLRNFTGNLAQGNIVGNIGALNGGIGLISLSAPGQGRHGSVQVALPTMPSWLLYDWNGDGAREEPSGLATFGIFEGPKPLIFRRELYRGM